jgi:hypothetical protein
VDVAVRGSGADSLVDAGRYLLEIAGRSRRSDFEAAWQQRLQRLRERATSSFSLCVLELETPAGRLLFRGGGAEGTMAEESFPINNLLAMAKSREVQRAMLAEMRGDRASAVLHFLAAGHMELVLTADYDQAAENALALRSRLSAASCFWRAGQPDQARAVFKSLLQVCPDRAAEIQQVMTELAQDYPGLAS